MLFTPKWYFLCKHASRMKVDKNIKTNVRKGDWYYSKNYRHVKNYKLHVSHNHESVVAQVANGLARKKVRRVMQFATILHLLQQGCPMMKYEVMNPIFEFLVLFFKKQQTLKWSLWLDHGKIHASRTNEGNHYKLG
jgi:hypothetical protein